MYTSCASLPALGRSLTDRTLGAPLARHLAVKATIEPPPSRALRRITLALSALRTRCRLTTREWEILVLSANGLSRGEIVETLGIAKSTYDTHAQSLAARAGAPLRRIVIDVLRAAASLP